MNTLLLAVLLAAPPQLTPREALVAAGIPFPEVSNMACGLAPLPPLGCRVGPCVCDQNGQNCQWTFICK